MNKIIPKTFFKNEIGKIIKSTKMEYTWQFICNNKEYIIIVKDSCITGKIIIHINKDKIVNNKYSIINKKGNYDIYYDNINLKIIKTTSNVLLQINGILFDDFFVKEKYNNINCNITNSQVKIMNNINNEFNINIYKNNEKN